MDHGQSEDITYTTDTPHKYGLVHEDLLVVQYDPLATTEGLSSERADNSSTTLQLELTYKNVHVEFWVWLLIAEKNLYDGGLVDNDFISVKRGRLYDWQAFGGEETTLFANSRIPWQGDTMHTWRGYRKHSCGSEGRFVFPKFNKKFLGAILIQPIRLHLPAPKVDNDFVPARILRRVQEDSGIPVNIMRALA